MDDEWHQEAAKLAPALIDGYDNDSARPGYRQHVLK
jgi:hypothetical protein